MKRKITSKKKTRSRTPGFREVLKYLPGEMKKIYLSPVKKFGKLIKRQLDKQFNYMDKAQEPERSRTIDYFNKRKRKTEFNIWKSKNK
ncbi:MAG: hypothetical protein ACTSQA_01385 [Candidatus Heimdallarchaeaceae archaeon]